MATADSVSYVAGNLFGLRSASICWITTILRNTFTTLPSLLVLRYLPAGDSEPYMLRWANLGP